MRSTRPELISKPRRLEYRSQNECRTPRYPRSSLRSRPVFRQLEPISAKPLFGNKCLIVIIVVTASIVVVVVVVVVVWGGSSSI